MGAKSFIRKPEMQRNFVLNDKLVYTLRKWIVSMSTVNGILYHGIVYKNNGQIYAVTYSKSLNLV